MENDTTVRTASLTARILVVDDEAELTDVMRQMLESAGYEVATAESGAVALELLATARFDAIVSDLRMPDMDGVAFLRALRRQPVHRLTPVVLTTAESDDSELLEQARALGVAAVVKKPWSPQALRGAVHQVIESSQG